MSTEIDNLARNATVLVRELTRLVVGQKQVKVTPNFHTISGGFTVKVEHLD